MKDIDMTKLILAACISMIVTGATAWLVFGQDKISRSEMEAFVGQQVTLSGAMTNAKVTANEKAIVELRSSMATLVVSQQQLVVDVAVLVQKMDTYLESRE